MTPDNPAEGWRERLAAYQTRQERSKVERAARTHARMYGKARHNAWRQRMVEAAAAERSAHAGDRVP